MEIKDFKEKNEAKQKEMERKLSQFKRETINSMWYFVTSVSKAKIVGSKG